MTNLTDPIFSDERKAREYFEAIRWPHGPVCPHCGNADASRIYAIAANVAHKVREGLHECQECHGQFTVRTGSVMESSHLPLTKWALAYRLMASAKKGISAHQMHRTLGVTYKTAWFLCHRIREAMRELTPGPLGGEGKIIEADETFIGPKDRNDKQAGRRKGKPGPGGKRKIVTLVERKGRARSIKVERLTSEDMRELLIANASSASRLMTDEAGHYLSPGLGFARHDTVKHGA